MPNEKAPDAISIPFVPSQPCPCGSGVVYRQCHGQKGGASPASNFLLSRFDGNEVQTGAVVEGCYMSSTCDCGGKLTREHYISASVLEQFGIIQTTGAPGGLDLLPNVPVDALVAKVLCARHNSALSAIDQPAGLAFAQIARVEPHLTGRVANRKKQRHFLVDGFVLEYWGLKTLLATHAGGVLRHGGERTRDVLKFDMEAAVEQLWQGRLASPSGMYLRGKERPRGTGVSLRPLVVGDHLVGIRVQLVHIEFDVLLESAAEVYGAAKAHHRPSLGLYWNRAGFVSALHIAWDKEIGAGDWVYREELD